MRSNRLFTLSLGSLLLLCACMNRDQGSLESSLPTDTSLAENETWTAELVQHRQETDEWLFTSDTSPMAGTQYLKSEPVDRVFLVRQEKTFHLADTAESGTVMSVAKEQNSWHWTGQEDQVTCSLDGDTVTPGTALEGRAICEVAGMVLSVYPGDDRVTFIVFDPEREEKRAFEHLFYYPPDRDLAVQARLAPFAEPEVVEMPTNRNLMKTYHRYAKIHFQVSGVDQELTAFKYELTGDASRSLFIPFKDATTGRETYGAGRFLEIDEPEEDLFTLDFNRAFNPFCNYSPAYNCTLPPRENRLQVPIEAGEKTYPQ